MTKASDSISGKVARLRDTIRIHGGRMGREELADVRVALERLVEYVGLVDALHDDPWAKDGPANAAATEEDLDT